MAYCYMNEYVGRHGHCDCGECLLTAREADNGMCWFCNPVYFAETFAEHLTDWINGTCKGETSEAA